MIEFGGESHYLAVFPDLKNNPNQTCKEVLAPNHAYFIVFIALAGAQLALYTIRQCSLRLNKGNGSRFGIRSPQGRVELTILVMTIVFVGFMIIQVSMYALGHSACEYYVKGIKEKSLKHERDAAEIAKVLIKLVSPMSFIATLLFWLARFAMAQSFFVFRLGSWNLLVYLQYFLILICFLMGGVGVTVLREEHAKVAKWFHDSKFLEAMFILLWLYLAFDAVISITNFPLIFKVNSKVKQMGYGTKGSIFLYAMATVQMLATVLFIIVLERVYKLDHKNEALFEKVMSWTLVVKQFVAFIMTLIPGLLAYRDTWQIDFRYETSNVATGFPNA